MIKGTVVTVCRREKRGGFKDPVDEIFLRRGHGVENDGHAGNHHRQVSLLDWMDIDRHHKPGVTLEPDAWVGNIITRGIDYASVQDGRRLCFGDSCVLQITQHCKHAQPDFKIDGKPRECLMPSCGVFARVVRGGPLKKGAHVFSSEEFDRPRAAVVTVSDRSSAGDRQDESGPLLRKMLADDFDFFIAAECTIPDDYETIREKLVELSDSMACDLVITSGGTGLSLRDVTPEATLSIMHREVPGIAELIRIRGIEHTQKAVLSRGVCVQRGQTLIINMSGSPKAAGEQFEAVRPVLAHALKMSTGIPADCAKERSDG